MVGVLVRGWGPDNEFVWIWRLAGYWAFAFWVMVGLVVANWCDVEGLRRGVVVGVVGGLWGWDGLLRRSMLRSGLGRM